jgi:hypothetical protein
MRFDENVNLKQVINILISIKEPVICKSTTEVGTKVETVESKNNRTGI